MKTNRIIIHIFTVALLAFGSVAGYAQTTNHPSGNSSGSETTKENSSGNTNGQGDNNSTQMVVPDSANSNASSNTYHVIDSVRNAQQMMYGTNSEENNYYKNGHTGASGNPGGQYESIPGKVVIVPKGGKRPASGTVGGKGSSDSKADDTNEAENSKSGKKHRKHKSE